MNKRRCRETPSIFRKRKLKSLPPGRLNMNEPSQPETVFDTDGALDLSDGQAEPSSQNMRSCFFGAKPFPPRYWRASRHVSPDSAAVSSVTERREEPASLSALVRILLLAPAPE